MMNEKFKDFVGEYDKFLEFEVGDRYERLEDWFYTLQQRHKVIRKKLGGFSNTQLVKVKNNTCSPVSVSEIASILNDINYYLPNYKKDNGFTDEVFTSPNLPDKKGKLTRHLLKYAKDKKMGYNFYYIERKCSDLSNAWEKSTIDGGKYYLKIDTTAMAFIKLGHYGCDDTSCFGQDGCHWEHKFNLGRSLNTFVCLVSTEPFTDDYTQDVIVGRAWGYLSNKGKVFNISNLYCNDINILTLAHIVHKGLEQITNDKLIKYSQLCAVNDSIYQNSGSYSFSTCKNLAYPQKLSEARFLLPKSKKNKMALV